MTNDTTTTTASASASAVDNSNNENEKAWVVRLERRLSKLADTASKESMQTLAKWIGFHRKHAAAFAKTLADAIADPTQVGTSNSNATTTATTTSNIAARQKLYLQILHETIVLDSGTSKWDRLGELREIMGERAMVEVASRGCSLLKRDDANNTMMQKVEGMIKEWDAANAFGGPTMINLIKKKFAAGSSNTDSTTTTTTTTTTSSSSIIKKKTPEKKPSTAEEQKPPEAPTTVAEAATEEESNAEAEAPANTQQSPKRDRSGSPKSPPEPVQMETNMSIDKSEKSETSKPPSPKESSNNTDAAVTDNDNVNNNNNNNNNKSDTLKTAKKEVEYTYDFESKNIPFGKVGAQEFSAPCKAIATLQIARDMRNDSAVQLSSLLAALPDDLKAICDEAAAAAAAAEQPYSLSESKARELSLKISEKLLDMDLEEQIQNVRTFLEIVQKQRTARERLIYLLVRSRCQFGANEAAREFYQLDETMAKIQKVKDTLQDAMALEGLDFEQQQEQSQKQNQSPSPNNNNNNKKKKKSKKEQEKLKELKPLTWYVDGKDHAKENGAAAGDGEDLDGDGDVPQAKRLKLDE